MRHLSLAPGGGVSSAAPEAAPSGCARCLRSVLGRLKKMSAPFWYKRAAPVLCTMAFEIFDVGSDVATYVRVVAPSELLGPVFKRNYLAWCCLSVLVSLLAIFWYARSLWVGYRDFKHNMLASSGAAISPDALNVVGVKSRLQASMLLAVSEDIPSVALNGWVMFGLQHERCISHSWTVLTAFIFSCFSVGYKLAAYQTFWQFRHVLEEWERKRGVIEVLEQAFERSEDARTGFVWMRVREGSAGGANADARGNSGVGGLSEPDRPQWHGLVTDSVLQVAALANPRLARLDVSSLQHVGDGTWAALEAHCPQLRELSAWGFELVQDGHGVGAPLSVLRPSAVTDAVLSLACAMCPALAMLDLSHTALTDEGVELLAQRAPELRELVLAFARQLTDRSASALAHGAPRLARLSLRCTPLSAEAAEALAVLAPKRGLRALQVEGPCDWLLQLLEWGEARSDGAPQPPLAAPPTPAVGSPGARAALSPVSRALRWQMRRAAGAHSCEGPQPREPTTAVRVRRVLGPGPGEGEGAPVPPPLRLTDSHVLGLAICRPELLALDLTRCAQLTGQAALAIAQLPLLRRLSVRDCYRLRLHDIRAIAHGCRQLRLLDLEGTWQAGAPTDAADLRLVLSACLQLQLLGCNRTSLSDDCAHVLATYGGCALREVRAWHCARLGRGGAGALQHRRPEVELVLECRHLDVLDGLGVAFPQAQAGGGAPVAAVAAGGTAAGEAFIPSPSVPSSAVRLRAKVHG